MSPSTPSQVPLTGSLPETGPEAAPAPLQFVNMAHSSVLKQFGGGLAERGWDDTDLPVGSIMPGNVRFK